MKEILHLFLPGPPGRSIALLILIYWLGVPELHSECKLQPHMTTLGKPKPVAKIFRSQFLPHAGIKKHSEIPFCSTCNENFKSTLRLQVWRFQGLICVGVSVTTDVLSLVSSLDVTKFRDRKISPDHLL